MDFEFMWRLRKALEDKGITRTELSNLSGVSKGDITHYLKGDYVPKQDKCYLLAKALGVDPGWLMVGYEPEQESHDEDDDILETLHQDPRLRMLFDRTRNMSDQDKEKMLQIADVILGELGRK